MNKGPIIAFAIFLGIILIVFFLGYFFGYQFAEVETSAKAINICFNESLHDRYKLELLYNLPN